MARTVLCDIDLINNLSFVIHILLLNSSYDPVVIESCALVQLRQTRDKKTGCQSRTAVSLTS